jgi:diguanylate cyclase (GGDEF)-like protein
MMFQMSGQSAFSTDSEHPLSARDLAGIAAAGTLRQVAAGTCLFERGEPASTLYLIQSGEVELQFEEGKPGKRLGAGSLFGELVLLHTDHHRTARAVAVGECVLLELGPSGIEAMTRSNPEAHVALLKRGCLNLLQSERGLIDELRQRNQELERTLDFLRRTRDELDSSELRAQTDELTCIYNRRCLNEQIGKLIERARATSLALALILIDVDRFKDVNDQHGHQVGDLVLQRLANNLRGAVRWSDLPCRIGGDEFALVLTDLPTAAAAESRAARVFASAGAVTVSSGGVELCATTSHGGAGLREQDSWETLYARADASLYLAKRSGRNRLAWEDRVIQIGGRKP